MEPTVVMQPRASIHAGGAVSAAGSQLVRGMPIGTAVLTINVKAIYAGSSITYSVVEVDAGDGTTALGGAVTGAAISAAGVQELSLTTVYSGAVLVSWSVAGSGAAAVYSSLLGAPATGGGGGGGGGSVTQGTTPWICSGSVTQGTTPWICSGSVTQGTTPWICSSPAPTFSSSLATQNGVVKAGAGVLKSVHGVNRNAAQRYLQLFNQTTAPSGSPSIFAQFPVPAGAQIILGSDFFSQAGISFSTGIAWGFSTAAGAYTAATAADHDFQATYT